LPFELLESHPAAASPTTAKVVKASFNFVRVILIRFLSAS